ncbi:2-polyprenyl-6-methoxyphenol hydroxylase-like FAD-dependent oxidoreductase [Murinocardiopsis flavida]|uniref:2-polyprenyl-6-methoxyphenol hydroxylase-like FAD-dependent oxidoreductase n=1 Tax=Murinocardiopsis flavida TaxID=645275 RepID=A0A2P8DMI5_9ACTN|nr:FAD-dependent monooxygenase [Murinocardiopsis flavida]PSK98425.1 2-polyprenyl-6-methoxyphenol hydroxylase-like FAD-dependent oxidoreductase [Murinocardiopsis flavida]
MTAIGGPERRAVVIGGGIGGLAAAVALRRIGWTATVLERGSALSEIGAGMSQAPNALRALDALGVGERARAAGRPFYGTLNLRTPSGRHLMRVVPGTPTPLLGFHRADLHRVLLDAVPPSWVRPAARVADVRTGAGAAAAVVDGVETRADLIVAADGANSTARRLLWPRADPPRFRGHTVWRGIARAEGVEGSMTLGRGGYFLAMPVGGGRVYWAHVARAAAQGIRHRDEPAELRRRLAGWHAEVRRLLAATPPEAVLHHDITDLAPLPTYVKGRVALLGDAAHPMYPDLGQGAGQAIEDAVVLGAALAGTADIDAALLRYDRERRPRSQWVAKEAARNARSNLSSSRLAYGFRVAAVSLVPSKRWPDWSARALSALWGWTPPDLPEPGSGAPA